MRVPVAKRSTRTGAPAVERGVSLIEVMVSVLVLGIALLGMAAMQAAALRKGQSSLERGQVVVYSYSILDAMRANRSAAIDGHYDLDMACELPDGDSLAQIDLRHWIWSIKQGMGGDPDADLSICGEVKCVGETCTVTVQWDDSRGRAPGAAGDASHADGSGQRRVQTVATL